MPKKKKVEDTVEDTVKQKNETTSTLGVSGKVKVQVIKNKKAIKTYNIHNQPTIQMLYGIIYFLKGEFKNAHNSRWSMDSFIPKYLSIGSEAQELASEHDHITSEHTKLFSECAVGQRFELSRKAISVKESIEGDTDYSVSFVVTALIPSQALSVLGGDKITEMGLFYTATPQSDTMLARISCIGTDTPTGINVDTSYSLYVEWTITIKG